MQNPLLSLKLWKNGDCPGHFVLQIFILSKLYSDIAIQKADFIAVIKHNMIRNHIILGKDRRKGNCCIQNRLLDGKFLLHHDLLRLDAVKKGNFRISCLAALHKISITVKVNIAVQIRNASYNAFFFDADDQFVPAGTSDIKTLNIRKFFCRILGIKQRCKNGIGCH